MSHFLMMPHIYFPVVSNLTQNVLLTLQVTTSDIKATNVLPYLTTFNGLLAGIRKLSFSPKGSRELYTCSN